MTCKSPVVSNLEWRERERTRRERLEPLLPTITGEHLPLGTRNAQPTAAAGATTLPAASDQTPAKLHGVQRALIAKALTDANGTRSHTARLLGLSRGELYTLLRRYSM